MSGHLEGWAVEGSVVTAPDGTKVDLWAMKSVAPQFSWLSLLEALAKLLIPLHHANTTELRSAIAKLQSVAQALQNVVPKTQEGNQ